MQNSGDQVELTVRAMPELAELCDRTQRGVRDTGDSLMLPPVSNTYLDEVSPDNMFARSRLTLGLSEKHHDETAACIHVYTYTHDRCIYIYMCICVYIYIRVCICV